MESVEDFLEHFGIRGMRWGVRRKRGADGTVEGLVSDDAQRATVLKTVASTKGTRALSNKDLQDLNARLNLEQQYSKLTSPESQSVMKKGQSFFKKTLGVAKTAQEVYNVVNSPVMTALKKQLNSKK